MNTWRHGGISSKLVFSLPGASGIGTAALGLAILIATSLYAAPVTLMFEATVGPPRQGFDGFVPPEWNISLQQGDNVSGTFTFEPFEAPSNGTHTQTVQESTFRIVVDSFEVATSRYELRASNNETSDESPTLEDRIDLRCAFGGELACNPQVIPATPQIEWAFFGALVGGGTVLDGPDIPADVAVWNQFSASGLLFTFSDRATGKSTGFSASINSLWIVPEPSTACPFALLCGAGACKLILCGRGRTRHAILRPQQRLHSHSQGDPQP